MLEIDESEFDPHYLPPLTPTPRSLISSQPQSVRSGRSTSRSLVAPQADDTIEKPRLTLKQVSRGHREWTSGLCDCFDDRHVCWYGCICAPVVLWNLGERLGDSNACLAAKDKYSNSGRYQGWYGCICAPVVLWNLGERLGDPNACLAAWLPGTSGLIRTKIRTVGGIKGSILSDCCSVLCCPCCSVCQMAREVDHMLVQPEQYVRPVQ